MTTWGNLFFLGGGKRGIEGFHIYTPGIISVRLVIKVISIVTKWYNSSVHGRFASLLVSIQISVLLWSRIDHWIFDTFL